MTAEVLAGCLAIIVGLWALRMLLVSDSLHKPYLLPWLIMCGLA